MKEVSKMLNIANEQIIAVQISQIFKHLPQELLRKIPVEIIEEYKDIADNSKYKWIYDNSKILTEQNLCNGTRQLMYNLILRYMLDENKKKEANKYRRNFELQLEKKKREKYNPDNIFANRKIISEEVALIEVKKNKWYKKLFLFFRKILKRY